MGDVIVDEQMQSLLVRANRSFVRYRGAYAKWSAMRGIGYNEMLVLYTIHESGFCTQKQICDSFLLPRQTIHNVISAMRKAGTICVSAENSVGHEKAFVLTPEGEKYAVPLMDDITSIEERAIETLGLKNFEKLAYLTECYESALNSAMEERK